MSTRETPRVTFAIFREFRSHSYITQRLTDGVRLAIVSIDAVSSPMLRITRIRNAETTTLVISGRIDAQGLSDLRGLVEAEQAGQVVLDLNEVSLVDVEAVRFLLRCDTQGIRLTHCPAYIHEWMVREKRPR